MEAGGAAAADGTDCIPNPCPKLLNPYVEVVEFTTSGLSGPRLFIKVSNGMDGVGDVTCMAPVTLCSGVVMGFPVFGCKNGTGYFSWGTGCPAGLGWTNSGVTMTINSVFCLLVDFD